MFECLASFFLLRRPIKDLLIKRAWQFTKKSCLLISHVAANHSVPFWFMYSLFLSQIIIITITSPMYFPACWSVVGLPVHFVYNAEQVRDQYHVLVHICKLMKFKKLKWTNWKTTEKTYNLYLSIPNEQWHWQTQDLNMYLMWTLRGR